MVSKATTPHNLTSLAAALHLALLLAPGLPAWACEGSGPMRQINLGAGSPVARATICLAPGTFTTLLFDRPLQQPALPPGGRERLARWEEGSTLIRLEPLPSSQPLELRLGFSAPAQPSTLVLSLKLERPGSPRVDEVVSFTTEAEESTSCREALRQKSEQVQRLQDLCALRQIELPGSAEDPAAHAPIPLSAFMSVIRDSQPLGLELAASWRGEPPRDNHVMNGHIYRSSGWSLLQLALSAPASRASEWLNGQVQMEDPLGNVIKASKAVAALDGSMLVGVAWELREKEDFALKLWPRQGTYPLLQYRVFLPAPSASPSQPAEPGNSR